MKSCSVRWASLEADLRSLQGRSATRASNGYPSGSLKMVKNRLFCNPLTSTQDVDLRQRSSKSPVEEYRFHSSSGPRLQKMTSD
ncbi:unnamed protein product [Protopolystoma xenopodis]|uniref:Uncharacterized protein n=1 Tax=Protopolystoma xenopodis TaxID=117903 RepID=A0A448XK38_9PLAT|nr:unnamed protein product [Protopolystoma xenopodis]